MPLFHRSQSSARLPNGSSCHLNSLVFHNDDNNNNTNTANETSISPSSVSLLPLRNSKQSSSRQALHASSSVISFGSVGSRGGRSTPNTPSKRSPRYISKIRYLRKHYPQLCNYIPEAPNQKQKLILATLILMFVHRGDISVILAPLVGKLVRTLITDRIIKYQSVQSSPEGNALWKASIRLSNPPYAIQTPKHLRQSSIENAKGDLQLPISDFTIDLVISHCSLSVDWIFTSFASPEKDPYNLFTGYDPISIFRNVTIISKCNQPVVGAPSSATIIRLPNVGRCDHSYAYYLANCYFQHSRDAEKSNAQSNRPTSLDSRAPQLDSNTDGSKSENNKFHVTLFLKDNDNHHRAVYSRQRSLIEMLEITRKRGFACHEERIWTFSKPIYKSPSQKMERLSSWRDVIMHPICQLSSYHNWTQLQQKQMANYVRLERDNKIDQALFRSTYGSNLGEYATHMGMEIEGPIVPVCYGGNFMASAEQLYRYHPDSSSSKSLWHKMEASLSRASSIAEGHFAERLWAALLSLPLTKAEVEELEAMANSRQPICNAGATFQGALTKY